MKSIGSGSKEESTALRAIAWQEGASRPQRRLTSFTQTAASERVLRRILQEGPAVDGCDTRFQSEPSL